jgi:hypothetical protein
MPGLIRGVARTAVIAGTASAVAGRVNHRQQEKWASQDQQQYDQQQAQQQQYAPPPQQYAPPPQQYAPPPPAVDPIEQLTKLGQLHAQGILTDEEFAAQKAKILGT